MLVLVWVCILSTGNGDLAIVDNLASREDCERVIGERSGYKTFSRCVQVRKYIAKGN